MESLPYLIGKDSIRFARLPAETDSAYRPVPAKLDLNVIFSFQHSRIVANDNTVRLA